MLLADVGAQVEQAAPLFGVDPLEPADDSAQRRHPTYGDYFGMTSLPDGTFRVMWPQMREGRSVLLTTTITSNESVKK